MEFGKEQFKDRAQCAKGLFAMRVLEGQQVLMGIFLGEANRHDGRPLYEALVEMLRREKIAGATVLRAIQGFGANSHMHTAHVLQLSQDLQIVVEVVDEQMNLDRVMP